MTDGKHRDAYPPLTEGQLEILDQMTAYTRSRLLELLNENQTLDTIDGTVVVDGIVSLTTYHYEQWLKALEANLTRINQQIAKGIYDLDIVDPASGALRSNEQVTYANGKCCNGRCIGIVANSTERKTAVIWQRTCKRHAGVHSAVLNTNLLEKVVTVPPETVLHLNLQPGGWAVAVPTNEKDMR